MIPVEVFAHEKSFPTKLLKQLDDSGEYTFREADIKASKEGLATFEKRFGFNFSKGDLAGPLYLGSDKSKNVKVVVVFLDGKSENGDTEFGAAVTTAGKLDAVAVFSSPESADATSPVFLKGLKGKGVEDLETLKKDFSEKEKSKKFIVELAQKAIGRIEASFKKK